MSPSIDAVFNAALSLPPDNRAALAEKLLESLDDLDQTAVDAAWAEEAQKRIEAFEQGAIKAIPGDQVFASLPARSS